MNCFWSRESINERGRSIVMDEQNNMCWTRTNKQPCCTFWTHICIARKNSLNFVFTVTQNKRLQIFAIDTVHYRLRGLKQYSPLHAQQWHQRDYLGAQHCPFPICRCISHVRSFSSSHHPRILFSISSIVTVDWCYISAPPPPPSSRQTHRRAKQFLHLHAWGDTVSFKHLDTWENARRRQQRQQLSGLGFTLVAASLSAPRQLVISVRIMREKFKNAPALIHWVSLSHLTAGHCFLQEKTMQRWGKNSNI